jgi:hypothetical protein
MTDIILTDDEQKKGISVTLSQETFSDIILSFLGTKEKLEYKANEQFLLRHNDIEQFYHLIEQKIAKEKDIHISHFSLSIIYNDKTTREINGIDAVSKFLETRDVIPVSMTLSWNILVSFPNAQSIENQKIDLSFLISNENFLQKNYWSGGVILSIQHTHQAWGIEILNLLRDKIVSVTSKEKWQSVIAKKVLKFSVENILHILSIAACILLVSILLSALEYRGNKNAIAYSPEIFNVLKSSTSEHDRALILEMLVSEQDFSLYAENKDVKDKLSNFFIERTESKKLFIWLLMGLIATTLFVIICIIWYCRVAIKYYSIGSYILITRRAEKEYEQELDDRSKVVFWSGTLITGSIVCSIIAGFIYTLLIS